MLYAPQHWKSLTDVYPSRAGERIKASTHALHALLGLIINSWETTVTSQALDSFTVWETSFLTSSPSFQRQSSPQGGKQ